MPPEIRPAFEKYREQLEQEILIELEPAWGGGAVPVPVEFDPVTSLGPATSVHVREGIRVFPNFGPPRLNALVLYRDGFAFRTGGKDLFTWRWEEVAVIQSKSWGDPRNRQHESTLTKSKGEKVILDDGLKDINYAIVLIKEAVFARLLPPLAQGYDAGQAVTFGPVTIHKQNGIQLDGKPYAWNAILDIKVESGMFTITLRDGKKSGALTSAIPNIELLGKMIGAKGLEYQ